MTRRVFPPLAALFFVASLSGCAGLDMSQFATPSPTPTPTAVDTGVPAVEDDVPSPEAAALATDVAQAITDGLGSFAEACERGDVELWCTAVEIRPGDEDTVQVVTTHTVVASNPMDEAWEVARGVAQLSCSMVPDLKTVEALTADGEWLATYWTMDAPGCA